ncbi:transposase, partial [mine drainage metagenome]
ALAQDLKIPATIDGICGRYSGREGPTPGTLLTVWAINRVLYPESATQLERWVPTTDLPRLTGTPAEAFTKDAFLTCLDRVCWRGSRHGWPRRPDRAARRGAVPGVAGAPPAP